MKSPAINFTLGKRLAARCRTWFERSVAVSEPYLVKLWQSHPAPHPTSRILRSSPYSLEPADDHFALIDGYLSDRPFPPLGIPPIPKFNLRIQGSIAQLLGIQHGITFSRELRFYTFFENRTGMQKSYSAVPDPRVRHKR